MEEFKKNQKCKKCGNKDIAISYHKGNYKNCSYNQDCRFLEKEHLSHYCRKCGYEWATKCLKELLKD